MKARFINISVLLLFLLFSHATAYAVTAVSTINVTVARYLAIINTSTLEFGTVSVSATAGSVVINADGIRYANGGVKVNPAGSFTPAKFIIEGKPNANFAIALPTMVELRDGNGNTIEVTGFKASTEGGQLDANGVLEIRVGGQIDLDANQASGDYSGTMILELNYS